jgi:site-specific DNA-methyltransferase (adenine-specific)
LKPVTSTARRLRSIVKACSNPGELVIDPMAGTGSVAVAAVSQGRRFLGIELCEVTAEKARQRLIGPLRHAAG